MYDDIAIRSENSVLGSAGFTQKGHARLPTLVDGQWKITASVCVSVQTAAAEL